MEKTRKELRQIAESIILLEDSASIESLNVVADRYQCLRRVTQPPRQLPTLIYNPTRITQRMSLRYEICIL